MRVRVLGCLLLMVLAWYLLSQRAAGEEFVLVSVECRAAFDRSLPASSPELEIRPSWTGETLSANLTAWDRRPGTRAWVLYRVCAPEDPIAARMIAVRRTPQELEFPIEESLLRDVPIHVLEKMNEQLIVQVADINLSVGPGEEVRVGVAADPLGRWNAFTDPEDWARSLDAALSEGRTVGVWVIQNLGTITYASVVPESGR